MQKETNGLFPHHLNGEEKLLGLHLEVHWWYEHFCDIAFNVHDMYIADNALQKDKYNETI
jgi:hypothetical protein